METDPLLRDPQRAFSATSGPGSRNNSNNSNVSPLLQAIVDGTNQLNQEMAQLSRLIELIGTSRDNDNLRQQLSTRRSNCANIAKSTMTTMKNSPPPDKADKPKYEKILNQFNTLFSRCQALSKESIQRERLNPLTRSGSYKTVPGINPAIEQQRQQEQQQAHAAAIDSKLKQLEYQSSVVDDAIIAERDEDIKQLETQMKGLQEVFVDVATMIQEQGVMLNTVEDNVEVAVNKTTEGVAELKQASEYQKSARNKMCCILLLVVLILAALGIVFGVIFGVVKR